jgi:hypothetical protein
MIKSPLDFFIEWLEAAPGGYKGYASSITFLVLYLLPNRDFEIDTLYSTKQLIDYCKKLKDPGKIVGFCLFLKETVNYIVRYWGNMERALDLRDMYKKISSEEKSKGNDASKFDELANSEGERFYQQKEVKESWDKFQEDFFNHDVFSAYEDYHRPKY